AAHSCQYRGSVADCAASNLTAPPTGLSQNTTELDLQGNRLGRLDFAALGLLQRARVLNCSGAGVTGVSGTGAALPRLRQLDLSRNALTAVAANTFRSFAELRRLDLSHNRIGSVADAGLVLPRLAVLDLSHNLLTALTRFALIDLAELRELDLSHNLLLRLASDAFASARNFSRLDLSHNRLSRLDGAALRGLHAASLDLSDNLFRRVPTAALKAVKLVGVLELSGCPVERLSTRALHKIAARDVRLRRAAPLRRVARHAVDDMPLLERLTLAENPRLDFIQPEMARRVPSLRYLNLSGNALLALSQAVVPPAALQLDLRRNPLRCDCALRWLRAPAGRLTATSDAVCAPPGLRAQPERCAPHVLPLFQNRSEPLGQSLSMQCASGGWPLNAVSVTSNFVTVSWSVAGGSLVAFLLIQEPPAGAGNATSYRVNNMGLQAQSFTFNHLEPGTEYTFWLALPRAEYVIRLASLRVTTRQAGFLYMRGRRKNYASVIAMAVPAAGIVLTCLALCARRLHHWRRHRRNLTLNQLARSGVLPSTSNTSDMAFLNHSAAVNAAEEAERASVVAESTCSVISGNALDGREPTPTVEAPKQNAL
ncbi:leucine-rich repeat neuronal protein 2-like, partial [Pollicipes pollicipes]|uniref:leucine-rich repeat neuronal protein 2-like n=1 Tax=Pollicipes pollicipes TaxID=41117 RepID=UPI001884BECE